MNTLDTFSNLLNDMRVSYWQTRHDKIMGNLLKIWAKLDKEGKEAFLDTLSEERRDAVDKICINYNYMHLVKKASDALNGERRISHLSMTPSSAYNYMRNYMQGVDKGLTGEELLAHTFGPCNSNNDELIKFFDMLYELHDCARMYIAKLYDGDYVETDKILVEEILRVAEEHWQWARDHDLPLNKSAELRYSLVAVNKGLESQLSRFR